MNLKNLFQDFNPSKFVVFSCLLVFTLLLSLRIDGSVDWSYWLVFLPIWLWKLLVLVGAAVGTSVWLRNPQYRLEAGSSSQYKGMILSCAEHLGLVMFEVLAVVNLQWASVGWLLVFIPLFVLSFFCIGACIWRVKNDRSCELELFCSVNILQFIFLALRLDDVISWSWVIVFIPVWIVMCVAMIFVLYSVGLAIILLRSPDILSEQRRENVSTAIGYVFFVVPLLVFEVRRIYICESLLFYPGWFGIRKDFCLFLLGACPCLQEYGNISYSLHSNDSESQHQQQHRHGDDAVSDRDLPDIKVKHKGNKDLELPSRAVLPVLSIETPD
ncbi:transmembrane protein 185A [Aplysia californica]|uniref:Transmembrane protein 185A n=1 Tax=Aplysia californica TaxID=6500 RepID=A0ABM1ACU2_APLCA|nr:transmembrane protein 185A [Aplysia californica]